MTFQQQQQQQQKQQQQQQQQQQPPPPKSHLRRIKKQQQKQQLLQKFWCLCVIIIINIVVVFASADSSLENNPSTSTNSTADTFDPDEGTRAIIPLHLHHGTLHVHLYAGYPPQQQILIVDTGSRYMSFPCNPFCKNEFNCGKHISGRYYDLNRSSTHQIRKIGQCFIEGQDQRTTDDEEHPTYCTMKQMYLEGSFWDAYQVEDIVWLGTHDMEESVEAFVPLIAAPYTFGCQKLVQGLFANQYADGILGLTRHETNYVRRLYEDHHVLQRNAFSICVTSTEHGTLTLGGSLPTSLYHYDEPMKYTKLLKEGDGLYGLGVTAVYVGDICVTCAAEPTEEEKKRKKRKKVNPILRALNSGSGVILDTGTTDTYLAQILRKPFVNAWLQCTGQTRETNSFAKREQHYTYEQFQKLCSISIIFAGNVTLTMEPDYFMEGAIHHTEHSITNNQLDFVLPYTGTRKLSNRVYMTEEGGGVLGVNAMIGYDILYDYQGGKIGIAKATCPT